jgi:hypothetical protein
MASIIYLFSDSLNHCHRRSRYVVLFVCFLYIVTKPLFNLLYCVSYLCMLRTDRVQASTEKFVQKAVIFASVVAFVAVIFGVFASMYDWSGYITGGLAILAVSLGLSSLLGVKRFRDFIVSCGWFGERQGSVRLVNFGLSLINAIVTVDFIVDTDGNVYEVGDSAELL